MIGRFIVKSTMKTEIQNSINYFEEILSEFSNQEIIEKIISNVLLFTDDYSEEISNNFTNLVLSLGQYVAGDEK